MKRPHEPLTARQPSAAHLIAAAVLLWLVWLVRAHHILQLPVFVDESLHIIRGKIVWEFSDWGESLNPKKLLYYYWIGLFGLNAPESAWLARMSTALAALPGAALTYALARRLFDRRAGLLALVLYALVPFMVFFERLALADAFTATICTAAIYTSIDLARRPAAWRGGLVGALLGLAVLAKLIALPFVLIPPLAIFLYDRTPETRYTPGAILRAVFARSYRRPLIAAAALFLVVLAPSLTYVIGKEITGTKDRVVVEEDLYTADNRVEQIAENAERTFRAAITLLAPEFVALAG
ncbi:MAG: glycosyltransferase family 39 protein, partial [Anaerolineae bacterium]|nr:glycosyltransferase family 39 protein [Anaerolineae bacterium]